MLLMQVCAMDLPEYVVVGKSANESVLRQKSEPIEFINNNQLSKEDEKAVSELLAKFDAANGCAGLAASQIGYSKRFFVLQAPNNEDWKKWRKNLTDFMDKTIFINPSYKPVEEDGKNLDWEGCFSIADTAAEVNRWNTIDTTYYDEKGQKHERRMHGFLARVFQHEYDHLEGVLMIDKKVATRTMPIEEYRAMRKKAMEEKD